MSNDNRYWLCALDGSYNGFWMEKLDGPLEKYENDPAYLVYDVDQRVLDLIPKFHNGEERVGKPGWVNQAIARLARGEDPVVIIDELITEVDVLRMDVKNKIHEIDRLNRILYNNNII